MLPQTSPAARGDSLSPPADFRIDDPREVAALLRRLCSDGMTVHLSGPGGAHLATTLWSVDGAQQALYFSAADAGAQLQPLIDGDEAVAVAYLDNVKLQFDLHALVAVRSARSSALKAALPNELYRFQRRGAYRVRPGENHAPRALLRHPALPEMQLALRVLDISSGGCALLAPHDVPPLPAGVRIGAVRIELDAGTAFDVMLTLQHVSSGIGAGGDAGVRLGCEWGPIDGPAGRALQRWIDQTQKRGRA